MGGKIMNDEQIVGEKRRLTDQLLAAIKDKDIEAVKKLLVSCDFLKKLFIIERGYIIGPNKEGTTVLAPLEVAKENGCEVRFYQTKMPVAFYALKYSTKEIADLLVKNGAATEGFYDDDKLDFDYKLNYKQLLELLDREKKLDDLETKCFGDRCGKLAEGAKCPEPPKPSKLTQIKYEKARKAFCNFAKQFRVERKYYSDEECTQEIKEPVEEEMVK